MDAAAAIAVGGLALGALAGIGRLLGASQTKTSAPIGTTHLETVKTRYANSTINQWAKHGWTVVGQSSAKSFGTQAQVTITFQRATSSQVATPPKPPKLKRQKAPKDPASQPFNYTEYERQRKEQQRRRGL